MVGGKTPSLPLRDGNSKKEGKVSCSNEGITYVRFVDDSGGTSLGRVWLGIEPVTFLEGKMLGSWGGNCMCGHLFHEQERIGLEGRAHGLGKPVYCKEGGDPGQVRFFR